MQALYDSPAPTRTLMARAFVAAALVCEVAGCTYSGANREQGKAYQPSTADPYTSEFQQRIPPGGD